MGIIIAERLTEQSTEIKEIQEETEENNTKTGSNTPVSHFTIPEVLRR